MKNEIHPEYDVAVIRCGCGNSWETRSTKKEMRIELCSECHPFFTGEQRIVDTAGRVERFRRRYGIADADGSEPADADAADAADEAVGDAVEPVESS